MRGLINGLLLGGLIEFFMDPVSGKRRRALVRDKYVHYSKQLCEWTDKQARDKKNRLEGALHEARGLMRRGTEALQQRARLGQQETAMQP